MSKKAKWEQLWDEAGALEILGLLPRCLAHVKYEVVVDEVQKLREYLQGEVHTAEGVMPLGTIAEAAGGLCESLNLQPRPGRGMSARWAAYNLAEETAKALLNKRTTKEDA